MSEFPRVSIPGVSEESREEVQRLVAKEKHEQEVRERNLAGMRAALILKRNRRV